MDTNQFLWVIISLVVHAVLVLPLLANWVLVKPAPIEPTRTLQVHMAAAGIPRPYQESRTPTRAPSTHTPNQQKHATNPRNQSSAPSHQNARPSKEDEEQKQQTAAHSTRSRAQTPQTPQMPSVDHGATGAPVAANPGRTRHHFENTEPVASNNSQQTQPAQLPQTAPNPRGQNGQGQQRSVEEPPQPLTAVRDLSTPYDVQQNGFNGQIVVEIGVELNGTGHIKLIKTCGFPSLDTVIIDALRQIKWRPATRNGQPVVSLRQLVLPVNITPRTRTFDLTS